MEKPPQLKEELDKLVSNGEQDNVSSALQTVGTASGGTVSDGAAFDAQSADTQASIAAPVQVIRDSAAEREAKKLADQEFLAAYKKHELFLRIRFGVICTLLIACFAVSIPKFFKYIDRERQVVSHVGPAVSAALLGEKDAAYYQTSQLPIPENQKNESGLIENRKKILDHTIAELEGSGRTAIFSRLGAEQLLMKNNQREIGLKYGEYLIDKYPNLPSNFLFRAEIDLDRTDINRAISEYDQFFALIKNSPKREKDAWQNPISNAIWGCIDYGRVDKAKEYLQTYKSLGTDEWDYNWDLQDIQQSILIAEFDQLDVTNLRKTNFWSPALEQYSSSLMKEAVNAPTSPYGPSTWESTKILLRVGNFKKATAQVDHLRTRIFGSSYVNYRYAVGASELALAQNRPQDAIEVITKHTKENPLSLQLKYLLATALERTQRPQQAIDSVDAALSDVTQSGAPGVYAYYHYTNYRLPLMIIKARALIDSGKIESALNLCNEITELSPDWIAPKLLKLEIAAKQNNLQEQTRLTSIISSQLKKVAP
jgi:tetratricopeptide (TPR) repeat protein